MGRDGSSGFHPFKGRVSKHFGDSVGLPPSSQITQRQRQRQSRADNAPDFGSAKRWHVLQSSAVANEQTG